MAGKTTGVYGKDKLAQGNFEPIPAEYGPVLSEIVSKMLTGDLEKRPDADELLGEVNGLEMKQDLHENVWNLPAP
jgi:hypothetical protein